MEVMSQNVTSYEHVKPRECLDMMYGNKIILLQNRIIMTCISKAILSGFCKLYILTV